MLCTRLMVPLSVYMPRLRQNVTRVHTQKNRACKLEQTFPSALLRAPTTDDLDKSIMVSEPSKMQKRFFGMPNGDAHDFAECITGQNIPWCVANLIFCI